MRVSHVLAALSLGAAELAAAGCGQPGGRERLVRAVGVQRPFEPRFTGGFAYAPVVAAGSSSRRSAPAAQAPDPAELRRAFSALQEEAAADPSPQSHRAEAVARLWMPGGAERIDAAVAALDRDAAAAPDDGSIASDLAATRLIRARVTAEPADLTGSLLASDRAVQAATDLAEGRFNRALALEGLFLHGEAQEAWRSYLALDGSSGWANEARAHLRSLGKPSAARLWARQRRKLEAAMARGDWRTVDEIADRHRQAVAEYAEEELLGAWGDAMENGAGEPAARILTHLRGLGAALAAADGERLIQDTAEHLAALAARHDTRRLRRLAAAFRDFRDGHRLYKTHRSEAAAVKLAAAAAELARAGSPFAPRATFFVACCEFHMEHHREALAILGRLARLPAFARYAGFRAHVSWMDALTRSSLGDLRAAIQGYERALQIFSALGELENVGAVHALLGESLARLGSRRAAWEHCFKALRTTPAVRDPRLLYLIFVTAADVAAQLGEPEIALYFEDETVRHAAETDPALYADALLWHGLLADRLGDRRRARADLALSRAQALELRDDGMRRRMEANLAFIEGSIAADARRGMELLGQALQVYEQDHHDLFSLMAYLARARADQLAGEPERAESDLRSALAAYERLGSQLPDEPAQREELRLDFLAMTARLFDELIALEQQRGRADRAFAVADRGRTRVLPPRARQAAGAPTEGAGHALDPTAIDRIRAALPARTALVQLSVLEDRLLVWVLRRERPWDFKVQLIPRREIERRIADLRAPGPGETAGAEWSASSFALYDALVRPWLRADGSDETLVFIPDKGLDAVPFACLKDRTTGHYLVEDHTIATAPSATLYVRALGRSPAPHGPAPDPMLLVGDPAFDLELFPHLERLRGAAAEVAAIARFYPDSRQLTDKAADVGSFLALAPRFRRIHFAGHSLADRDPLFSLLLFAPGRGSSGVLYARDVYGLDLAATELLVLAGCDTEGIASGGREGLSGLARAFLAAGVRTVVATLWSIDDGTTDTFFRLFYSNLRSHADPALALRQAQLAMLHGGDKRAASPAAWGAFQAIGASAP